MGGGYAEPVFTLVQSDPTDIYKESGWQGSVKPTEAEPEAKPVLARPRGLSLRPGPVRSGRVWLPDTALLYSWTNTRPN